MSKFDLNKSQALGGEIYTTAFEGVYFLKQTKFKDERGFYSELSRISEFNQIAGLNFQVAQINISQSKTNVARGFHSENWHKLITPLTGKCLSVIADFRPESPTFAKTIEFELSNSNGENSGALFLPPGIGNSFLVLEGPVNYLYSVDSLYRDRDISGDLAISLFDPDLSVNWPIAKDQMIISDRDKQAITLRKKYPDKFPQQ